ncbi:hypothetical protein NQ318_019872 [Aromia moschata]|uniref:D-isomer specific 2-hydroxyacid dehydrogenase NAD-binding domain-containing protein n=1 Tax=Aromia moschata TaxID=1265417 RepID=A0AAV8YL54_9CUCU|nr:hypothetical protein NQ318_019872 [Aromia moschata]
MKMSSIVSVASRFPNICRELQKILPSVSFHQVDDIEKDEQFFKSNVIVGDYHLLGPHIYNLTNARWIQGTMAGIDALLTHIKPDQPPPFPISRFSGKHFGHLIGEYVVANIINHERNMFEVKENQRKQQWIVEGKNKEPQILICEDFEFYGSSNFGYGRRSAIDLKKHRHISRYFNKDGLIVFLQSCDYIVNILPSTMETRGLLNGNVLENCKGRGVVFINVGRGSIISEETLVKAVNEEWLSGAILDVFEREPLREESPLWKMPNVSIHFSSCLRSVSKAKDIAEQFKENLQLFQQNLPIPMTTRVFQGLLEMCVVVRIKLIFTLYS